MLLLLIACANTPTPEIEAAGPIEAAPEVEVEVTEAAQDAAEALPEQLTGRLSSPECGDRAYPRVLELSPTGTYTMTDLVSPCPPGGMCAWSGVVVAHGEYALDGAVLTLNETKAENGDKGAPRPQSLRRAQNGQLMEPPQCLYGVETGPVGVPAQP